MRRRITIEDVAKAAGVSRQTVSRAINDKGEISKDTKARVMQAVDDLDYKPNRLAQGMVTQRTHTIGLVLADITNPFFPEVARGVQDVAIANHYNVIFCNTDDDPEAELLALNSLAAQAVDGIILFSHRAKPEALRAFADDYRPIVIVNRFYDHPNIAQLIVDNYLGAQIAARHFLQQDRKQLGMIVNERYELSKVRRVSGFRDELANNDIDLSDDHFIRASATLEGGYQAATQLLTDFPDTDGIFAYNDLMGIGAIRACHDLGRNVPEDCAIIGFDDIGLAAMISPSLTTIRVNKYDIGRKAGDLLLKLIIDPKLNVPLTELGVELIIRESA